MDLNDLGSLYSTAVNAAVLSYRLITIKMKNALTVH